MFVNWGKGKLFLTISRKKSRTLKEILIIWLKLKDIVFIKILWKASLVTWW